MVEAYAKGQKLGWRLPKIVVVPHENMGVAMAHGYAMVTGKPQAMMVHVGVGTANSLNGLINASRQNVPILFTAGRTPITESGARHRGAQQLHPLGAGALRPGRHAARVREVGLRAAPRRAGRDGRRPRAGDREERAAGAGLRHAAARDPGFVFFQPLSRPSPRSCPASPPAADPEALEEAAKLLGAAQHPLLITANGGRTLETSRAIEQLAHNLAVPVVHYRPRHLALSTEHPMHCGWDPHALLKEADVVLVVDCDVPWIPKEGGPKADAKVIHIGPDPLFAGYPLRGFRTDIALTGAVAPTLQALWRAAQKQAVSVKQIEERRKTITAYSDSVRKKARGGFEPMPASITGKWLSACVNKLLDERTILVNEYPTVLEEMVIKEPGRYFGNPSAGGLGWGMGAALGAKLASPDKTVICAVGDGAYMFGNPTAAHYVSEAMHLPVLFVIANNARWAAVHRSTLSTYPKGHALGSKATAVRHARALAALRARGAGVRRPRRARHRAEGSSCPRWKRR